MIMKLQDNDLKELYIERIKFQIEHYKYSIADLLLIERFIRLYRVGMYSEIIDDLIDKKVVDLIDKKVCKNDK